MSNPQMTLHLARLEEAARWRQRVRGECTSTVALLASAACELLEIACGEFPGAGMIALPANCESGRHRHCGNCGDPVTHSFPDVIHPDRRMPNYGTGLARTYVNRAYISKIRRYCPRCLKFAQWLALPEGGDVQRVLYRTAGKIVIDGNSYLNDLPHNRDIDFTFRPGLLTLEFN